MYLNFDFVPFESSAADAADSRAISAMGMLATSEMIVPREIRFDIAFADRPAGR